MGDVSGSRKRSARGVNGTSTGSLSLIKEHDARLYKCHNATHGFTQVYATKEEKGTKAHIPGLGKTLLSFPGAQDTGRNVSILPCLQRVGMTVVTLGPRGQWQAL